jgi:hypothetical protein
VITPRTAFLFTFWKKIYGNFLGNIIYERLAWLISRTAKWLKVLFMVRMLQLRIQAPDPTKPTMAFHLWVETTVYVNQPPPPQGRIFAKGLRHPFTISNFTNMQCDFSYVFLDIAVA